MNWPVFYYVNERGDSPVEEFLEKLSVKARAKCLAYLDQLEEHGFNLPSSYIKKVEDEVWELRPEFGGTEYCLFYFAFIERQLVVVHAITKKGQKLKAKDINLALARVEDVRRRAAQSKPTKGQNESQISPTIRGRTKGEIA